MTYNNHSSRQREQNRKHHVQQTRQKENRNRCAQTSTGDRKSGAADGTNYVHASGGRETCINLLPNQD